MKATFNIYKIYTFIYLLEYLGRGFALVDKKCSMIRK